MRGLRIYASLDRSIGPVLQSAIGEDELLLFWRELLDWELHFRSADGLGRGSCTRLPARPPRLRISERARFRSQGGEAERDAVRHGEAGDDRHRLPEAARQRQQALGFAKKLV